MSASHAVLEGERFGPYRVLSKLASGGMADVWFVESVASSTRGVLKTMRPELATSSELTSMFIDEGRVAAELQHENVAKVLDVGVVDGRAYIAMEFVHGRTLRQIAQQCVEQQHRMDAWFLLRVVLEVCSALEYLHSYADAEGWHLGLMHGDVSPENIMVGFNGSVKLVDFGITRAPKRSDLVIGKPWYMAPEQINGSTVDHRSDLYALGVVLYECLTGYRPYTGATHADVLARALEGRPAPPQEIARGISEPLAWTALRAMARDPDHRFSTAADFAAALRARLRELDAAPTRAHARSLDGYMAALFGEPDTLASSIMRTISERVERANRHSDLPTAPCAPSVVAAAIAKAQKTLPPPAPPLQLETLPPETPMVERSGEFPAQRAHSGPDIFARAPRRELGSIFGGATAVARTAPIGGRPRSNEEREAARLFEDGLERLSAKDFAGAQEAWLRAIELDPRERRYQINLKRLQERFRDGDQ